MNKRVASLALIFSLAGAVSVGCGSDDDSTPISMGGAAGTAGAAGKGGSAGKAGSSGNAGSGNESGSTGEAGSAGSAGTDQGGAGGDHDETAGSGPGGQGGEAGAAGHVYTQEQIDRGMVIVRSMALCGGCHTTPATSTAAAGPELGGNPTFKNGTLPAPNLTDDANGIGKWTDAEVMNAFRNGIDDEGRHLDPIMPYWLFHNISDKDALSIVAFLRSLPTVSVAVGDNNPDATTVLTPLSPSSLPDSTLTSASPDYADAQQGKYLVSGVAQCVKCHSPSSGGLPIADFFSGVPPTTTPTPIFAPNITPDVDSGIGGWLAADVATALKAGTNKAAVTLCGSMPSAGKGYGGMTDADAHAIGVYLTTIPAVSKPLAAPSAEPACP